MGGKRKYIILLLVVGAVVFLFKLGGRDLWDPDEPRYAEVAREMRQSGNWIVPHLNGQIYFEKPPLFFWLINVSTFFCGDTELANRLPSALAGLATVILTFFLGSRLFNTRAGFLSGLLLASCFLFPQISRWIMLDSLFSLCFLLAVTCFYLGLIRSERQKLYFLLAGVSMGFATLTKGPIGYLPLPLFLIFVAICGDFSRAWNRNLLYGLLLSVAIVLAWFLPAIAMAGKMYGMPNLWRQTVGRFAQGWSHSEPFYFYGVRFPLGFLPWAVFIPWAVGYTFVRRSGEKKKEILFLFVWFVFVFLFFSLSKGKKDNYLLPLYPAAALGIGNWMEMLWSSPEERSKSYGKFWIPVSLISALSLVGVAIVLFSPVKWFPPRAVPYFPYALGALSLITVGGGVSLFFESRRRHGLSVLCIIAAFIATHVYVSTVVIPWLNPLRTAKPFSLEIASRMAPGDELKIWKFQHMGILYYTGKPMEQIRKISRLGEVFSGPRRIFMVVEEEDFTSLQKKTELRCEVVQKERVAHQTLYLVCNKEIK